MKKLTTADRLKYIMEERHLRQVDILRAVEPYCKEYGVKLERNTLSQYVSGKAVPRQDKLTVLGLGLNVSEAWLMGYDVPMERRDELATDDEPTKEEFIQLFLSLSEERQQMILALMKEFSEPISK